jgi:hypothetical protein
MGRSTNWFPGAVSFVPGSSVLPSLHCLALAGSSFEGSDGTSSPVAGTDWVTFVGSPRLKVGTDLPTGQSDDSLSGKEDDVVPGIDTGSIPSNKSDLLRFYAYHERVVPAGSASDFLYLAWVRARTRWAPPTWTSSSTIEHADRERHDGRGRPATCSSPTLSRRRQPDARPVALDRDGPVRVGLLRALLGSRDAAGRHREGAVNTTHRHRSRHGRIRSSRLTFGEAAIDLTGAGVFTSDACVSFGRGYVKSRSSNAFTRR